LAPETLEALREFVIRRSRYSWKNGIDAGRRESAKKTRGENFENTKENES